MSTTSIPDLAMPDMTTIEKQIKAMNEAYTAMLPREFAGPVDLTANPLAGATAFSALGLGLAGHAFGLWMGTMAGAAEAAQRMWLTDGAAPRPAPPKAARPKADGTSATVSELPTAKKVEAAVNTLAVDAGIAARETARVAADTAQRSARDGEAAVDALARTAPAEIMPEDFRRPAAIDKPAVADDLKRISGIGPKLETVLNGLGIWTYGQIAAWGAEEVAWVDDYLSFKGRIGRDGWIEQAKAFEAGK